MAALGFTYYSIGRSASTPDVRPFPTSAPRKAVENS